MANTQVRVTLLHAALDGDTLAQYEPRDLWMIPEPSQLPETSRFDVELARVVVENVGRTPIKIRDIAFDLGRVGPLSRERHTITLNPVLFGAHSPRSRARLEPFAETAVLLDVWPAVQRARKRHRTVVLRASVQVSRKRFIKRSPWSQRWTVNPGQRSLRPWRSPEPDTVAFQVVWRLLGLRQDTHFVASAIGHAVHAALENVPRMTVEDLTRLIEDQFRDLRGGDWDPPIFLSPLLTAYQIAKAFRLYGFGNHITAQALATSDVRHRLDDDEGAGIGPQPKLSPIGVVDHPPGAVRLGA